MALKSITWVLLATWALCSSVSVRAITPPAVVLTTGTAVGVTDATTGLDQFLGIPFAQPPVGPLRFAAPVPLPPSSSKVFQATSYGNVCIQVPDVSYVFRHKLEIC